jgi:hypothetical protein
MRVRSAEVPKLADASNDKKIKHLSRCDASNALGTVLAYLRERVR